MDLVSWVDPRAVREELSVEDPADIGSHEFLRFVMRVSESMDIDIPKQEYERLVTLEGCVQYLTALAQQSRTVTVG